MQTQESTYKNTHWANTMVRFTPNLPWKFYYLSLSFFQMGKSKNLKNWAYTLNYLHVFRFLSNHSKLHRDPTLHTLISNSYINLQNNNQTKLSKIRSFDPKPIRQNSKTTLHSKHLNSLKLRAPKQNLFLTKIPQIKNRSHSPARKTNQ